MFVSVVRLVGFVLFSFVILWFRVYFSFNLLGLSCVLDYLIVMPWG